jgi:hypothetical protein
MEGIHELEQAYVVKEVQLPHKSDGRYLAQALTNKMRGFSIRCAGA